MKCVSISPDKGWKLQCYRICQFVCETATPITEKGEMVNCGVSEAVFSPEICWLTWCCNCTKSCNLGTMVTQWLVGYTMAICLVLQHQVSTEICLRGVHDEIHNIKKPLKPCLLKYFKWLLRHQRQRAHFVFKPVHK